jgi:bacterioferritin (cytochrome b1)
MEVDRLLRESLSRRRFLRASGAGLAGGSAAALLAACGGGSKQPRPGRSDIEVLNRLLDVKNTAIAVYVAGAPLLKGELLRLARQFIAHEKEHADVLAHAVLHAGGTPHKPRSSYGFPAVRTQTDVLTLADGIERKAIAACIDALATLSTGELRARVASIVASDAEHLAVVRQALGRNPAPRAFEKGQASG